MGGVDNLPCIKRAAALLGSNYYIETAEIEDKEVAQFAALSTPTALDSGDFFELLSRGGVCSSSEEAACRGELRKILNLPETDPEGVTLSFKTSKLTSGGQVAITVIKPSNLDPSKPPIVFAGGLYHKTAVYFDFLVELAKREGREIYAYDSPGVGGSRLDTSDSVNYEMLYEALTKTLEQVDAKDVVVMGHSLGTIPVRHLYFNQGDTKKNVAKFVMIAPVPAEAESKSGLTLAGSFQKCSAVSMLDGEMDPCLAHLFFQNHPEEEKTWLEEITGREIFPINIIGFLAALSKISDEPILDVVGKDPKLELILAGDDHLMRISNPESWSKNGITFIDGADHSFIAGHKYATESVDAISQVINKKHNKNLPTLDVDEMVQRVGFEWGLVLNGDFGNKGARGLLGLDARLSMMPVPFLEILFGARLMAGGGPEKKIHAPISAYSEILAYYGRNSRFYNGVGVDIIGWDFVQGKITDSFVYGKIGYNIRGVADLSLQPGISINPLQHEDPNFWLRLLIGVPL